MGGLAALLEPEQVQVVAIPAAQPVEHSDREHREQAEPDAALPVGNDDRRRQQRAEGTAGVAADLEGRLRRP